MKIIITGIHGFVGTNLVDYLKSSNEIYGLDIVAPRKEGVLRTFSWNDLDAGNIPEVDAIIHLAGMAHDTKDQTKAEVYFKINTGLTQKIYDYFLASKANKFIFFSTTKAVVDKVIGVLTEDVVPNPVGPYGESKYKAEQYILSKMDDNKDIYILRPCMIHGPGNKGNLNLLYNVVSKGIPWPLGAFANKRVFTSIGNACFLIEGLLTKSIESGIYNICDDDAVSTNELIEIICQSLGKKSHIWHLPRPMMVGLARIGTCLHLPFNTERLHKLTNDHIVSNAKIKRALGVKELPVNAKDGFIYTIPFFKNK